MFRIKKEYGKRQYQAECMEPRRKYYIITEGYKTEQRYFKGLKSSKKDITLSPMIEIHPVNRKKSNAGYSNAINYIDPVKDIINGKSDCIFDKSFDRIWIIFDRDKKDTTVDQIRTLLDFSEGNDCVNLGLTNPYFEFWLLLHFDIIDNYSENDIKNLDLKKELKRILGSYNSSRLRFSDFKDGIGNALHSVEKFENQNLELLLDNIGSTVGNLMNELLYSSKMS